VTHTTPADVPARAGVLPRPEARCFSLAASGDCCLGGYLRPAAAADQRNVIISFEVNEPDPNVVLPDLNAALGRLLRNQADIGNAIKPYYGDAAGDQLTELLREHILIAGEILQAAKTGNSAALADAQTRWYENAHEIAVFLNAANPRNWLRSRRWTR
jgi:hypothetical protein